MKCFTNKDVCIGCGACTAIADNVFTIGDDGLAETINPEDTDKKIKIVTEDDKDNVIDAAESCPVGAIEIIEE